ncbi:MAG: hypothetical protein LBS50_07580 [Prevotellaceae bacterium]|jgi:hypothetical protein|nr:hypothetical protein [Prevotellaceae bacterium]
MNYIYPKLPASLDCHFFRIGGSGLANSMFVAARAYALAKKTNAQFINPTWANFSIGTYIRREKDKRHYIGLFKSVGVAGIKKWLLLLFKKKQITIVEGLARYFEDILDDYPLVKEYFDLSVRNTIQYNTIQYNTIQYNTIQYNTIQYNTIQYNTIQYLLLMLLVFTLDVVIITN